MPEPKWVIGRGVCKTTGGMFNSYSVVQGIDNIFPVDVYVPGCQPRPEALIAAVMKIQDKVTNERFRLHGERKHGTYRGVDPYYISQAERHVRPDDVEREKEKVTP